ncbi:hypothetical protein SAMD00019534_029480 [Acytostelium subglobosum LB1]|uniref:hypothetical protein n=1 Tax=Acytostelium subglobosum LB1 TaxID=1410327 RepID=UPI0006448AEF|nr:hypothetical protein SAMD00019534_029480 [Acytostelium subglobosum LB1]GAM19773.1 hypothetical protein SAMD00019534_029480 [Acytostelium subglobosum LB1]|eukprot:XP_012756535.1 hypothetical protein SAMD00019534_029480 [Acytostelium subglobosum LB1]
MTIIKSMTSLSFNASAFSNGSVMGSSSSSSGQSSNNTSGLVAQIGKDAQPALDGTIASVKAIYSTVIATADGLMSRTIGI